MTRTARPVVVSIIAVLTLAIVIVACGSSATPAPANSTSNPASSSGAGSSTGTGAGASNDLLGGLLGSLGLGSLGLGNLLHGAPDLEAILPAQMCGAPSLKFSFGGASFGAMAGQIPAFTNDFIGLTGKSMADVSFASATSVGSGNCPDITAFKVNGLDENTLRGFYTKMETSDGNSPTQVSLGGKNITKSGGSYAYFKNDTVFVIDASGDDAAATAALQQLP
jgi:hypothetical protein